MNHIFVSYSRQDTGFVDGLAADLERRGIEVWVDREDIVGGSEWRPAIVEAIRACKTFVLVLSPNSTVSKNVSRELSLAETHNKPIIPIVYQECEIPASMEYQLAEIQRIDFSSENYEIAFDKLLKVLGSQPAISINQNRDNAKVTRKNPLVWAGVAGLIALLAIGGYWWSGRPPIKKDPLTPTPILLSSPTVTPAKTDGDQHEQAVRLTKQARNELDDGKIESARIDCDEAIRMEATYDEAYFVRASAFIRLNQQDLAILDFKKVSELTSNPYLRKEADRLVKSIENSLVAIAEPKPTEKPKQSERPEPPSEKPKKSERPTTGTSRPSIIAQPPPPLTQPIISNAAVTSLVDGMFNKDRSSRINATTKLIIEQKSSSFAVRESVARASKELDNKSGVINTLVYLENVPPAILKANAKELNEFLAAIRKTNPGDQTQEHLKIVQQRLGS